MVREHYEKKECDSRIFNLEIIAYWKILYQNPFFKEVDAIICSQHRFDFEYTHCGVLFILIPADYVSAIHGGLVYSCKLTHVTVPCYDYWLSLTGQVWPELDGNPRTSPGTVKPLLGGSVLLGPSTISPFAPCSFQFSVLHAPF